MKLKHYEARYFFQANFPEKQLSIISHHRNDHLSEFSNQFLKDERTYSLFSNFNTKIPKRTMFRWIALLIKFKKFNRIGISINQLDLDQHNDIQTWFTVMNGQMKSVFAREFSLFRWYYQLWVLFSVRQLKNIISIRTVTLHKSNINKECRQVWHIKKLNRSSTRNLTVQ